MLSMSSVSHASVKLLKFLRRKSPSNRTSAVNLSILFWRARTFDRVIVGRGCLLPRFFSRSLTPPLDPRFLLFFSFPITSTMSQRFSFKSGHGVWRWKENISNNNNTLYSPLSLHCRATKVAVCSWVAFAGPTTSGFVDCFTAEASPINTLSGARSRKLTVWLIVRGRENFMLNVLGCHETY